MKIKLLVPVCLLATAFLVSGLQAERQKPSKAETRAPRHKKIRAERPTRPDIKGISKLPKAKRPAQR